MAKGRRKVPKRKKTKAGASLLKFAPAVKDFFEMASTKGGLSYESLDEFFDKWAKKESPRYAEELKVVIQAVLDAAALPPAKKAKAKPPGRRVGLQG
jgi:hypothetical protein